MPVNRVRKAVWPWGPGLRGKVGTGAKNPRCFNLHLDYLWNLDAFRTFLWVIIS